MSTGPVVAVFGPTGVGKTALAARLADVVPCHLISCDAVQVYRRLHAATAKPEGDDLRHPWALVEIAEPEHDVNLGEWVRAAEIEVARAHAAGRLPVVVGGTGLYLRGLLKGVAEAPPRDEGTRARLVALADRRGVPYLHRVLRRLDPRTAARLKPGDRQRIVRALEVRLVAGASLGELQGEGWSGPDRWPTVRIGVEIPREELYPRLDRRVEGFFARGLVDEARSLLEERRVPREANALKAIGYREVVDWLISPSGRDLAEVVAAVQRATRHYAKRQWTWFRREQPAFWIDARRVDAADELIERARTAL